MFLIFQALPYVGLLILMTFFIFAVVGMQVRTYCFHKLVEYAIIVKRFTLMVSTVIGILEGSIILMQLSFFYVLPLVIWQN